MRKINLLLACIVLSIFNSLSFADRVLERTEVLQILQALTNQQRKTWIPHGIIEATHVEHNASMGSTTSSTELIKYDGSRFYWEITIDTYTQTADPPSGAEQLDLNWNKRRVFAWDGVRHTIYFLPGNHAIVTENTSEVPAAVNGSLTAGIPPWGYGIYTYEELAAADVSATEVEVDGQNQVHMTILKEIGELAIEIVCVLDPTKDYAALSWVVSRDGYQFILQTYSNYMLVSGAWIPTTIMTDRYDNTKQPPAILTHDEWTLNSVNVFVPNLASFRVQYEADALVEYYSSVIEKPVWYRHYSQVDTDSLLQSKLAIASSEDTQNRNCATVSMKYALAKLGRDVNDPQLATLLDQPNESTSLYAMKEFAQNLGFNCLALRANTQTLRDLGGQTQAILHLGEHYVVFEYMDDEYVWIIDLDRNKFYYRVRMDQFKQEWVSKAALLISNEPLDLPADSAELNDEELHGIVGGWPPNYSCTDVIQQKYTMKCTAPAPYGLPCWGRYIVYAKRCACEEDENGGFCEGTDMVAYVWAPCVLDLYDPTNCTINSPLVGSYIRACECE